MTLPSDDVIITTRGLTKHFGDVRAVDGVNLHVRRGEIYGLLGRNGAGKTTTIRMLLGLVRPSAGDVTLLDTRVRPGQQHVFTQVGCLVETASAYPNLSVRENLEIHRRLTRGPREAVTEAIELLGLSEYANRLAGRLSLGNKQRLALARAVLHRPLVLVLDEPANALDPAGIIEVRGLLRRLADERGVTVLVSSHILPEVTRLADRIGIMHGGKLIEELGHHELHATTRSYVALRVSDPDRAVSLLMDRLGVVRVERTAEGELRVFDAVDRIAEIARVLVADRLDLTRLALEQEDLEAHFMRLTGGTA